MTPYSEVRAETYLQLVVVPCVGWPSERRLARGVAAVAGPRGIGEGLVGVQGGQGGKEGVVGVIFWGGGDVKVEVEVDACYCACLFGFDGIA